MAHCPVLLLVAVPPVFTIRVGKSSFPVYHEDLTEKERLELLRMNPVMAARHFRDRCAVQPKQQQPLLLPPRALPI